MWGACKRPEMLTPPAKRRLREYIRCCLATCGALPIVWMIIHSPSSPPKAPRGLTTAGFDAIDLESDVASRRSSTQPLPREDVLAPSSSSSSSSMPLPTARFLVSYVYYEAEHQSKCERDNKRTNLAMFLTFAVATSQASVVHFTFTFPGQGSRGA